MPYFVYTNSVYTNPNFILVSDHFFFLFLIIILRGRLGKVGKRDSVLLPLKPKLRPCMNTKHFSEILISVNLWEILIAQIL